MKSVGEERGAQLGRSRLSQRLDNGAAAGQKSPVPRVPAAVLVNWSFSPWPCSFSCRYFRRVTAVDKACRSVVGSISFFPIDRRPVGLGSFLQGDVYPSTTTSGPGVFFFFLNAKFAVLRLTDPN